MMMNSQPCLRVLFAAMSSPGGAHEETSVQGIGTARGHWLLVMPTADLYSIAFAWVAASHPPSGYNCLASPKCATLDDFKGINVCCWPKVIVCHVVNMYKAQGIQ